MTSLFQEHVHGIELSLFSKYMVENLHSFMKLDTMPIIWGLHLGASIGSLHAPDIPYTGQALSFHQCAVQTT